MANLTSVGVTAGIPTSGTGTVSTIDSLLSYSVTGGTLTRPANTTAYAFAQLVANSVTAGSVVPQSLALARSNDQAGVILSANLFKSSTVLTSAQFRIHFYNVLPTFTNGDGAAWLTPKAGYLGSIDVTCDRAFSDASVGIGGPTSGWNIPFTPVTGTQTVYYVLEARAAYTPISGETFIPVVQVQ